MININFTSIHLSYQIFVQIVHMNEFILCVKRLYMLNVCV